MKIERPAYVQQLVESKDNGLIKIVTGLRRVGKSYLLKTLFKEYLLTYWHQVSVAPLIQLIWPIRSRLSSS